ncbi:MAG: TIGR00730 family Rossman fold protein [Acidimicrobiales bacterium]|nr:TIGR00730 family Rossman fold protein [Acidimicrobiales bacterium]
MATATDLAADDADRLDLKIATAALREMASAFEMFAPYRASPKITMFGSARTLPDDPLYVQARDLARAMAAHGWMVITGAGPGIMAAGMEGAGRERSFGVNIRLPHEQEPNAFIKGDPKLVAMKYFFTRKLELIKESDGFVVLPGGFGTLDELFETLTWLQLSFHDKPVALLNVGGFFDGLIDFIAHMSRSGFLKPEHAQCVLVEADREKLLAAMQSFRPPELGKWIEKMAAETR